ncbi:hypothetical protein FN846DRAFT_968730 [Sphaerosporella brunnea]|uniref:non-specific serine/threonine protein kinase n=1 Tax=Sphaerosporella brunnea TaxID=1250544 RepID=A0A5J5EJN6_9PEZI|nr:hypothetical protein FN846DRAFT_968730 [Sphaerosporella brunnea]
MPPATHSPCRKRSLPDDHAPRPPPASRTSSASSRRQSRAKASSRGPRTIPKQSASPSHTPPDSPASPSHSPGDLPVFSVRSEDGFALPPPPTPQRLPASAPLFTPYKGNSGNVRLHSNNDSPARCPPSLTVRSKMDLLLYQELRGHVEFECAGLWARFDCERFRDACVQASALGLHDGERWVHWNPDSSEPNVLAFLERTVDDLRRFIPAGLPFYRHVRSGSIPLADGDCGRKTDLAFVTTPVGAVPSWAHVRVVGELKSNPDRSNNDSTVVQLANYAREVFGNQPWRRSVQCFTLCGAKFRVWHFDRGGALGSTIIDIHADWKLFLSAMLSFATFGPTEIGFDPTIRCDVNGCEDTFDSTLCAATTNQALRPFIWIPTRLLDNATTLGPPPESIAGFRPAAWSKVELQPHSMAPRWAVVSRTAICARARLWGTEEWTFVVKDQWRAQERAPEGNILRICACKAAGVPECHWHGDLLHPDGHRIDIASLRPARAPGSDPAAARPVSPELRKVYDRSQHLFHSGRAPLFNRVHTRMLLSPVGRALVQFSSYTELLQALRTAVDAHRHMYTEHRVLHRDVSVNNVIILPAPDYAALIDFDLAILTTRDHGSGATHRTGTFDFMAHEVLAGKSHTALHDIESFFYVLLWLCIYFLPGGQRRIPTPRHTVFTDPKEHTKDPFTVAKHAKGYYARGPAFRDEALPTLPPEAQCLRIVFWRWHRLLFATTDDYEELEPSGADRENEIIEEKIQRMYSGVLEVLQQGIDMLAKPQTGD